MHQSMDACRRLENLTRCAPQILTNIAFMSGIIICHGVDIAITMLHSVTQACAAFPGVGATIREDFDQYLAVIVGQSDDLRTKKISFAELAVKYHLTGVREMKSSLQQVVDEVNEIGNRPVGWGSAYTLKASAYLQRARILSHGGSLKLDALLQHPVEFETACKALSRFFGQVRPTYPYLKNLGYHFHVKMRFLVLRL